MRLPRKRRQPSGLGRAVRAAAELFQATWTASPAPLGAVATDRVTEVRDFGSNPGALRMLVYAPRALRRGAPLIVVLHGCYQEASAFAADAGWIALAQRLGLALLLPEQTRDNNHGRCFNWFLPGDARRGRGEALSIRQMIRAAIKRFGSDPRRVFVVGLSAGGGMAVAMLAAYPAVFAGGAVVAGFPVGTASSPAQAIMRALRADMTRPRLSWAEAARKAAPPRTTPRRWPRLTIWQGGRDRTVAPGNADALAAQWSELHGYGPVPDTHEAVAFGVHRRAWGRPGRPADVELWTLAGMGHGFPVNPRQSGGGREGAWVLDAGLCGAQAMAEFWGIERGAR